MREQDYIDATNLAKLRIAFNITCSVFVPDGQDNRDKMTAAKALDRMIQRLEKRVTTVPATDERGE